MCNGREGFIRHFKRIGLFPETPPYTLPGEGIAQAFTFLFLPTIYTFITNNHAFKSKKAPFPEPFVLSCNFNSLKVLAEFELYRTIRVYGEIAYHLAVGYYFGGFKW